MDKKRKKVIMVLAAMLFIAPFIAWEQGEAQESLTEESDVWATHDLSPIFDSEFYLKRYSDLSHMNKVEALSHFLNHGMIEGRQASEEFNVTAYRNRYPDLRDVFGADLPSYFLHYLEHGREEGRDGSAEY